MGGLAELGNLLYPTHCAFCGKFLGDERDICPNCAEKLPMTDFAGSCEQGDFFELCVSPLYYEGMARSSMIRFKFYRESNYARCYGRLLAECVDQHYSGGYDLVCWVPSTHREKRKRGYDQVWFIAKYAAELLEHPPVRLLKKKHDTLPQSSLTNRAERGANVMGAFAVTKPELAAGRRVLVIDDIITTGATFSECARVLRMAGASRVICASVARGRGRQDEVIGEVSAEALTDAEMTKRCAGEDGKIKSRR